MRDHNETICEGKYNTRRELVHQIFYQNAFAVQWNGHFHVFGTFGIFFHLLKKKSNSEFRLFPETTNGTRLLYWLLLSSVLSIGSLVGCRFSWYFINRLHHASYSKFRWKLFIYQLSSWYFSENLPLSDPFSSFSVIFCQTPSSFTWRTTING